MTQDALTAILKEHPGRETLITTLHTYWTTFSPPFLHIYDPTTPQNTVQIVRALLSLIREQVSSSLLSIVLDATECVTPKLMFDRILNGLAEWTPDWNAGVVNWASSSGERYGGSLDAFIHGIRALHRDKVKETLASSLSMIIVITNAERLKENAPGIIVPLMRLRDLVGDHHHAF